MISTVYHHNCRGRDGIPDGIFDRKRLIFNDFIECQIWQVVDGIFCEFLTLNCV